MEKQGNREVLSASSDRPAFPSALLEVLLMKEQTAKADMGNIFQARCLDLAVAKYGLLILTINVNAMIRKEKGRRQGKTAGVVAVASHPS